MIVVGDAFHNFTDGVIKIGVLNDASGLYADLSGKGGLIAAQMAVDEMGGKIAGLIVA